MGKVATIVLGGGEGKRLHPLTLTRCKPALLVGGKFRLIDFSLANAIHADIQKIYVLTQFLATTLHRHLLATYRQIEILPCEQKPSGKEWYLGTADAVRHHLEYICEGGEEYFLILSGDQLYQMDFSKLVSFAKDKDADLVVASLSVNAALSRRMGILEIDKTKQITHFIEKPQHLQEADGPFLGSMGIYLFKRKTLVDALKRYQGHDFGHDLIPALIEETRAYAFLFDGYWEDIGTIESFYQANLRFLDPKPHFDFHHNPLFSPPCSFAAPKIQNTLIENSLLGEGSVIQAKSLSHCLIGPKTLIDTDTVINSSYLLGHSPIGKHCHIRKTILDENVTLGDHVRLTNEKQLTHYDGPGIFIRDGITLVTRGTHIPSHFTL